MMSLTRNYFVVVPYQPFAVGDAILVLQKTISPFALNFELRNFADVVYAHTATLDTNKS